MASHTLPTNQGLARQHGRVASTRPVVPVTPKLAQRSTTVPQNITACRSVQCRAASAPSVPETASANDNSVYDVVVVGAGISGLVTAQALATKHSNTVKSFLVTEARERVGGNITSMRSDDYIWEEGPNSFQPSDSVLEAAVRPRAQHLNSITAAVFFHRARAGIVSSGQILHTTPDVPCRGAC